MENVLQFSLPDARLNRKNVLQIADCPKDSLAYDDVLEEYAELESVFYETVNPQTRMLFDTIPTEIAAESLPVGTKVVYLMHTLGKEISELSTQAFRNSDYLKGMLVDAMATSYLFEMDQKVQVILKEECAVRGFGIVRRLEAPRNIPMLAQKIAREKLFGEGSTVVTIASSYMFDPPKTICQIFVLSDDRDIFHSQHDCTDCESVQCAMRFRNVTR